MHLGRAFTGGAPRRLSGRCRGVFFIGNFPSEFGVKGVVALVVVSNHNVTTIESFPNASVDVPDGAAHATEAVDWNFDSVSVNESVSRRKRRQRVFL